MTPPTPKRCKIKCDMFTCICADGSEAHDPPTPNGEVVRCWLCPGLDAGEALATVQPMHDSRAVVIMDAAAFDAMKAELVAMKNGRDAAERELAQEKEGSTEWEEESAAWSRKCLDVQEVCDELRAKLADAERERGDADDALAACQAQAAGTIARLREALDKWEDSALNLLAVVHRDGGQHTATVGFSASCTEAEAVVVALRAKLDAAVWERDAEYAVRKHVIHALEGQGLPKVMPEHGHGVIQNAYRLYNEASQLRAKLAALTAHMNQVHETLGGSDTVLTLEAALYVVAKLDEAVQKARYESDVAAQARAAKDAAELERDDAKINETLSKEQRAVLFGENAVLLAKLAEAEKDAARLDWMADDPPFDGLGDHDLYDFWHMVAHENGHEEATQEDKRTAFRRLLDTARTAATAKGE